MSAPTDPKPSFLSRLFPPRLSSHWASAAATSNAKTSLNRTSDTPPPIPSPPSSASPTVWNRAAPPFTPLRTARPASPVLTLSPLALSSWGSSSSTLGDLRDRYTDEDRTLSTSSSDQSNGTLFGKGSDNVVESAVETSDTLSPLPKSKVHYLLASSPRSHDDDDDDDDDYMDVAQDLKDHHQMRSPPRISRSPSPTSSIRGLPPSSPRGHDDDEDTDNMEIAVSEVASEQDAVPAAEDTLDLAPMSDAPTAALTTALAQHPLATRDNMHDCFLADNPPSRLPFTSSMTPASAFNGSDVAHSLAPVGLTSGLSPALLPPAATFVTSAPSSSCASRPHLPLPTPVLGKRMHHDSDEERVAKKAKEEPTIQPSTKQLLKRERRAATQRAWHKAAALAINTDDDVPPTTEHMEVDDGTVAAPDSFDRDWSPGTPIMNIDDNVFSAYIKRRTEVSQLLLEWTGSLYVSVADAMDGERQFVRCRPSVLSKLNVRVKKLTLGDTIPEDYLDALEAANGLDAEEIVVRVSGRANTPLFERTRRLLSLPSLRRVVFVSVGCNSHTRHPVPWEYVEHLVATVFKTERKLAVDHTKIFVVGAGNHEVELRNVCDF